MTNGMSPCRAALIWLAVLVTAPVAYAIGRRRPAPRSEPAVPRVGHSTAEGWCRIPTTFPHVDCEVVAYEPDGNPCVCNGLVSQTGPCVCAEWRR